MNRTVYIFSDGRLAQRNKTICLIVDGRKKYIPIKNVEEIFSFGKIKFNQKFLNLLAKYNICFHSFNYYGKYMGSFYPCEHKNSGTIILNQAKHYLDYSKRIILAKEFVKGASKNIRKNLMYFRNKGVKLSESISKIELLINKITSLDEINKLMALEGQIRFEYYSCFNNFLNNKEFHFIRRSRRPPLDKINALISFGNTVMYNTVLTEIYNSFADPRIGYLHSTSNRGMNLNLDISEIFKPLIVDKVIFTLINKNILNMNHFKKYNQGTYMNFEGRKKFMKEYDKKMQSSFHYRKYNRKISYRQLIKIEVNKVIKHVSGEETYESYVS